MKLVLQKSEWLDDWYVIEKAGLSNPPTEVGL